MSVSSCDCCLKPMGCVLVLEESRCLQLTSFGFVSSSVTDMLQYDPFSFTVTIRLYTQHYLTNMCLLLLKSDTFCLRHSLLLLLWLSDI